IRDFHVTGVQTCALPIWTCQTATADPRASSATSGSYDVRLVLEIVTGLVHDLPAGRCDSRIRDDDRNCRHTTIPLPCLSTATAGFSAFRSAWDSVAKLDQAPPGVLYRARIRSGVELPEL